MTAEQNHPITPPPELFGDLLAAALKKLGRRIPEDDGGTTGLIAADVAIQAARWGADQELEACMEWLEHQWKLKTHVELIPSLRAARRKPPSLKEQALALLDDASDRLDAVHENTIRRALEQLDD